MKITHIIDEKVAVSLVEELIEQSYELTKNNNHKRRKANNIKN